MTTVNPITGDLIKSKTGNKDSQKAYEDGWERIFGNKPSVNEIDALDQEEMKVNSSML